MPSSYISIFFLLRYSKNVLKKCRQISVRFSDVLRAALDRVAFFIEIFVLKRNFTFQVSLRYFVHYAKFAMCQGDQSRSHRLYCRPLRHLTSPFPQKGSNYDRNWPTKSFKNLQTGIIQVSCKLKNRTLRIPASRGCKPLQVGARDSI